jgi:hypothetical protein
MSNRSLHFEHVDQWSAWVWATPSASMPAADLILVIGAPTAGECSKGFVLI